ncbi:MAG: glycerophosphotransferase [Phenylobacterium sp.]|uniref:glycerophosphotransferase n=1 Tax=Phenylobacterium sp. TaxID=1871053 RepID=UPI001A5F7B28|nr:glycerophosphotransferase [Phenylobacterium sp.]MBL8554140.1 glycerophosphotransferase [Phenylobacterium sp.]
MLHTVCLLNIAQWHQALHVLPIAAALSRRGDVDVHVAVARSSSLGAARALCERLGARRLSFRALWPRPLDGLVGEAGHPPKRLMLAAAAPFLAGCDALVAPERTSLFLKRIGVRRPLMIHSDHGAGDRAVGYEARIAQFDYALVAGAKQEDRMLRERLIRPGRYRVVGYPKFEAAGAGGAGRPALFAEPRPTVLYNPHFDPELGSWDRCGLDVLHAFAHQTRFNLIFAPHLRLAQRVRGLAAQVAPFAGLPNVHVDLGSARSCDMTYPRAADVYLGDVSSQVYEFIETPRPCAFLDAGQGLDPGDPNAAHVRLGPVGRHGDDVLALVDHALRTFPDHRARQQAAFAHTFALEQRPCSERAAEAVVDAIVQAKRSRRPSPSHPPLSPAFRREPVP